MDEWISLEKLKKEIKLRRVESRAINDAKRKKRIEDKINRRGYIYCFECLDKVVVGKTIDLEKRFKIYECHNPFIGNLFSKEVDNIDIQESLLLFEINKHFKPCKGKEWFDITGDLLTLLKSYFDDRG